MMVLKTISVQHATYNNSNKTMMAPVNMVTHVDLWRVNRVKATAHPALEYRHMRDSMLV